MRIYDKVYNCIYTVCVYMICDKVYKFIYIRIYDKVYNCIYTSIYNIDAKVYKCIYCIRVYMIKCIIAYIRVW